MRDKTLDNSLARLGAPAGSSGEARGAGGLRRGTFCPERRAARMDRETVFLSVYRDFGGTGAWMEMFLHKGRLVSHDVLGASDR